MSRNKLRLPLEGPYDFVFGLGQNCANACYMTQWNLRTCSSPFDWLDGAKAGLSRCIDLICEDFRGFLEQSSLRPLHNAMGEIDDKNCDYYFDEGTGFSVMHDFPRGVPLAESHPAVRAKYRRRIDRLYARVGAAERTLFIYWARYEGFTAGTLLPLAQRLRDRFRGSTVDLLVIEHADGAEGIESVDAFAPGVVRVKGRFFVKREDNLVMGDERLNGRVYAAIPRSRGLWWMGLRQNAIRMAIRIVSSFCPVRNRRRALRRRWTERFIGKELV